VYSPNLGVNALTYSVLNYLEEIAHELHLNFHYSILGYNTIPEKTDFVVLQEKKIPFRHEPLRVPEINLRRPGHWLRFAMLHFVPQTELSNDFSRYDLVMDIGEGDSFADIYGIDRFIKLYVTKVSALSSHKTLVLLPQTIGPFKRLLSRILASHILRQIRHVYPRDLLSLQVVQKMIPGRDYSQYLDVAFHLPYQKVTFSEIDKIHVGMNVSALLWHGGYNKDNMFSLVSDYKELTLEILQRFLEMDNVVFHLVPHVVECDSLPVEDDYALAQLLRGKMPRIVLPSSFRTPVEAKSYISGLDFFVGARMHSCIAAYSTCVPCIPLGYSRKFSGLFVNTLGYPHVADLQQETQEEVLAKVFRGFENRQALQIELQQNGPIVEANIAALRQELAEVIWRVYENSIDRTHR
jgi:polysaccharide pyruvyl transferase WcaK-like protein